MRDLEIRDDDVFTVATSAALVGCAKGTIRREIKLGKLRAEKYGSLLIRGRDLKEWRAKTRKTFTAIPKPKKLDAVQHAFDTAAKMHGERKGFVYFIRAKNEIKIGFATSVETRMRMLQVGSAVQLELLAAVPGIHTLEQGLHRAFAKYRIRGEWFRAAKPILDFIAENSIEPKREESSQVGAPSLGQKCQPLGSMNLRFDQDFRHFRPNPLILLVPLA